jgi:hypothetical protein
MDRHALNLSEEHRFHGGPHRSTGALMVDTVIGEHLRLPLRRRSAVTPHGRDNEGIKSCRSQCGHDGTHDAIQVGDPAAAHADRDRTSGGTPTPAENGTDFAFHCPLDVIEAGRVQSLADEADRRRRFGSVELAS